MPKKPVRHRTGRKAKKQGSKDPNNVLTEAKLMARIARDQNKLAELRAAKSTPAKKRAPAAKTPETEVVTKSREDEGDRRVVVKFFYNYLGQPPEEDWDGRDGTIAAIRRFMGETAPWPPTVRRTLERLQDEDKDVARSNRGAGGGAPRALSELDDLYVGLLICEGYSQLHAATRRRLRWRRLWPNAQSSCAIRPKSCLVSRVP